MMYIFSQFIELNTFSKFKITSVKTLFFLPLSDRFEIEIEPLFASIALYDVKERKKVKKQRTPHPWGHIHILGLMIWGVHVFQISLLCSKNASDLEAHDL